ncbi:PepSY domain-containing protein [Amphritea sp.]|uniref:PepSY domain-containing protein n=1 Tax=Amphritea sp. TaxID=1872502 RepID=UPI0025BEEB09|nr:PepSY domain-containing protein [Amphritea sp.]
MSYLAKSILLLLICGFAVGVSADPQDKVDPDLAAELVDQGLIVSLDQLLAMHAILTGNRMLDLELEQSDEEFTYEIEVLHADGHVSEYEFDAVTGELLQETFGE